MSSNSLLASALLDDAAHGDPVAAAVAVAREAAARGAELDRDDAFPDREIAALARGGLLAAPVPRARGGLGLGTEPGRGGTLARVLRAIGRGSLPLGRLYEGHVNALALVARFGAPDAKRRLFGDALDGRLFGVWNTEAADGLRLEDTPGGGRLTGAKTFASGAGRLDRMLVTARTADGGSVMLVVPADRLTAPADLSGWRAQGMKASASGRVDFTGVGVGHDDRIGGPGDYHRQPWFSGGAWRFAAVQHGGTLALLDLVRGHLARSGRGDDPYQAARLGRMAIAAETGDLWLAEAARLAEDGAAGGDEVIAYVNMTRTVVERLALDALELAHRAVGVRAFLKPHPIERVSRDLATYLRQPAPDAALAAAGRHALTRVDRDDPWAAGA